MKDREPQEIETYNGYTILFDHEHGYHTNRGMLGYCETLQEIKDEIDHEIALDTEAFTDLIIEDTPSLPEPWWHQR